MPLQGDRLASINTQGDCPGLGASALYLSLRPVTVGSGRMETRIFAMEFT